MHDVRPLDIPYKDLNQAAGYEPKNNFQGFNVVDGDAAASVSALVAMRLEGFIPAVAEGRRDWSARENELLLDVYLHLLLAEMESQRPNKREALRPLEQALDQRTRGSIEFKMQNVSAILQDEGRPWIDGFKPLENSQAALRSALLEELANPASSWARVEAIQLEVPVKPVAPVRTSDVLVEAPALAPPNKDPKAAGKQVRRAWQGAVVDAANRHLGRAGEQWVCEIERRELEAAGRRDLAARVAWVAQTQGDGLGYDVLSFDAQGNEKWIEVKTTKSGRSAPFLITPNELEVWRQNLARFHVYRIFSYGGERRLYDLPGGWVFASPKAGAPRVARSEVWLERSQQRCDR